MGQVISQARELRRHLDMESAQVAVNSALYEMQRAKMKKEWQKRTRRGGGGRGGHTSVLAEDDDLGGDAAGTDADGDDDDFASSAPAGALRDLEMMGPAAVHHGMSGREEHDRLMPDGHRGGNGGRGGGGAGPPVVVRKGAFRSGCIALAACTICCIVGVVGSFVANIVGLVNWGNTQHGAVLDGKEVRVDIDTGFLPFSATDEIGSGTAGGAFRGLDVDLLDLLCEELVKFEEPIACTRRGSKDSELFGDLRGGGAARKADLAIGGIPVTLEGRRMAAFTMPYLQEPAALVVKCPEGAGAAGAAGASNPSSPSSPQQWHAFSDADAAGVRVVVSRGHLGERVLDERLKWGRATILRVDTRDAPFSLVLEGRADVALVGRTEARWRRSRNAALCLLEALDAEPVPLEIAWAMPQGDTAWLEFVDHWIQGVARSGTLNETLAKWGAT